MNVATSAARLLRRPLCFALSICGLCGCEAWLDVQAAQCKVDRDCVGLFGREYTCGGDGVCVAPARDAGTDSGPHLQLPARWACAAEPAADFVPDPDRSVTVRMDAVDVNTLRVPMDLVSKACNVGDVDCASPLLSDVRPGDDGFLEYTVPYGFEGFLTFDAPGFVPSLSYANRPYLANLTTSGPALSSEDSLQDIGEHSGREIDPDDGVLIVEVRDCNDAAGDGVKFDPIGDQTPFYFDGALPARGLDATTVSNQIAAGRESRAVGGYSNLPPGYVTVQARLATNDAPIARLTVQVRPSTFTYIRLCAGS
jgi:hypothetical protein